MALHERQMSVEVLPRLMNRLFHVTSYESYLAIIESGHISHNSDDRHGHVYGQSVGCIGRHLGAVCLFDLRNKDLAALDYELLCYALPTVPQLGPSVAFLFVAETLVNQLVQWKDLTPEQKSSGTYIPEIECWHSGNLAVADISDVLIVEVDRPISKGPAEMLAEFMETTGWRPGSPIPEQE